MPHNLSEPALPQDSATVPADARAGSATGARLADLLERGRERLGGGPGGLRGLDAELLLAHVLRRPRSHLLAHAEDPAPSGCCAAYEALLARAAAGEPLAYLTGQREFWSLPLQVCPAVLIPRPETELAVERCLALLPERPCHVGDLGTGSGAIACALASERPAWHITATDCSSTALHVARGNAARLGLDRIEFAEGDWFEPLGGRRFDLLVSNPPYVGAADPALAALAHEPRLALSPGPDALATLRQIIALSPTHLLPGGYLVLEHGADQGRSVERALVAAGYAHVRCHRDLAGHERVTEARWRQ
jgi:release factor glutamine methyltransferase